MFQRSAWRRPPEVLRVERQGPLEPQEEVDDDEETPEKTTIEPA